MAEYIERGDVWSEIMQLPHNGDIISSEDVEEVIKNIPAADVSPVVHGRWIKTEQENGCAMWTDFECSVCGSVFDGNERLFEKWKGCPMCFTRMDGE